MYTTYKFRGQDPVLGELKTLFVEADLKQVELRKISGVSASTYYNWWVKRKTRHPQNATVEATGRALGMKRVWVPLNGSGGRR